jgi:hypothetical protein
VGFVNQKGYLITAAPGTGAVSALYRGQLLTTPVVVVGPAPAPATYTLTARLAPDPYGLADRSQLVVRIVDRAGRPLAHAPITVTVTGGTADGGALQTDLDGGAAVGITWSAEQGGSARVSSGPLAPVTVPRPQ